MKRGAPHILYDFILNVTPCCIVYLCSMQIIPLSEGSFTIDGSKKFIPFNIDADNLQERATGSLLVEIQPFAVKTSKDIIVLDTGLGFLNSDGKMQLLANLEAEGIMPGDVTKVLMSHLHKDHASGVTLANDRGQITFPNATYYVQEREMEYALENDGKSYIAEDFKLLTNIKNIVWLKFDSGTIDDYIRYEITGAHSPFHQVFWITENNETIFFGADDAPQLHQLKHKFVAKYDHDGRKAMELRKTWREKGEAEGWHFLFYHDVKYPTVVLRTS